jgi:hypothetical protein
MDLEPPMDADELLSASIGVYLRFHFFLPFLGVLGGSTENDVRQFSDAVPAGR